MDSNDIIGNDFIAAIEIGSSKIVGMAGRHMPDGSIQIPAYIKENSSSFIRRGKIDNLELASKSLEKILQHLEDNIKRKISKIHICIGGQSLHSHVDTVQREYDAEIEISQEMLDNLLLEDKRIEEPNYVRMKEIPLSYTLGKEIVSPSNLHSGCIADRIEGHFLNIYYRKDFISRLKECLSRANFPETEFHLGPLVLGDCIIKDDAKRTGCVLVDLGAQTTTVAVYTSRLLRHVVTIPLGSDNITHDIASIYHIEEAEAERLKREYGSAISEKSTDATPVEEKTISISTGAEIKESELSEIIEARVEEIFNNVEAQLKRAGIEKSEDLISGAVLTGGGANLRNIDKAFKEFVEPKLNVAIVKNITTPISTRYKEIKTDSCSLNTILSMLVEGAEDSDGGEKDSSLLDFPEERYALSASDAEAPALNTVARNPEGWTTTQPEPDDKTPYVWKTEASVSADGHKLTRNWSKPQCITQSQPETKTPKKKKTGGVKKLIGKMRNFIDEVVGPEKTPE